MDFILLYNYIALSILVIFGINFLINSMVFRSVLEFLEPGVTIGDSPLVSILVPARNEEKSIRRCLRSLVRQDYPNIEIIVLDDNSTDATAEAVKSFSIKNPEVKLISGKPLIPGWLGKSYACQQLAGAANGQYLLFTDADTLHFPNSVSSALSALLHYDLGALSVFARQITVTLHERMMVPFGNFFLMVFMPFILILKSRSPLFCTAIGQFMFFRKDVYEKIGGHASVKKEILEDIHISKQVKKCGFKFMIFDGNRSLYCRMYKNLKEVIRGYSKVLAAAFDYNIFTQSFVTLLIFALFLSPFIMLPLAIFLLDWPQLVINLIIGQVFISLTMKMISIIRFKNRFSDIFLFPLSIIYLICISTHSAVKSKCISGVYWKGRTYDVRKEEHLGLVNDNLHLK
jgi:chlorobactene glucosyltransferase